MNKNKLYFFILILSLLTISFKKHEVNNKINIVFVSNNECIGCNIAINSFINKLNDKQVQITFYTNSFNEFQLNKMKKDLDLNNSINYSYINEGKKYFQLLKVYELNFTKQSIILFTINNKKKKYMLLDVVKNDKLIDEILQCFKY